MNNSLPDEFCPECDESLFLEKEWASHNYDDEFEIDCPKCEAALLIQVYQQPCFGASLQGDKEEV